MGLEFLNMDQIWLVVSFYFKIYCSILGTALQMSLKCVEIWL